MFKISIFGGISWDMLLQIEFYGDTRAETLNLIPTVYPKT